MSGCAHMSGTCASCKPRMPFGKYKGEPVEDLPTDYIEWALENIERLSPSLQAEMEAQLALRRGEGVSRGRA